MKTWKDWLAVAFRVMVIASAVYLAVRQDVKDDEAREQLYLGVLNSLIIDDEGEIHIVWTTPDHVVHTEASIAPRHIKIIRVETFLSTISYEDNDIVVKLSNDYELQYMVD